MSGERGIEELEGALAELLGAGEVRDLVRLSGGASRETWAFDAVVDGVVRPLVLQRERVAGLRPEGMEVEAGVLRAAQEAGVPVPAVVASDGGTLSPGVGSAFLVVERLEGESIPRRVLREEELATARTGLAAQCGEALAAVHRIDPAAVPALEDVDQLARYRQVLDELGRPHPAFELAFRWLAEHRPVDSARTVVHGDFRNGNLLVGPEGLVAVLDWELAHVGDPLEDLAWVCVRAWRFGQEPMVGGFGALDDLVGAYEERSGTTVDRDALHWWLVLGTLKWGIMCITQAEVHRSGAARSVELAAIGRRVCEQEHDVLNLVAPATEAAATTSVERGGAGAAPAPGPHGVPTAAELLEAVGELLRGDVMGATDGQVRFHARVAANVVDIVGRELVLGPAHAAAHAQRLAALGVADDAELAARIRSGDLYHRSDEVVAVVRSTVADKLAVANPRYSRR